MEVTSATLFLLKRYYIMVNFSCWLMLTRNGILLMKMMSVDTYSSLCDLRISLGILTQSVTKLAGLRLTNFPFNEVISGPKTSLALFTSLKVTGNVTIMFERTMFSKSCSDRNPSRCIARRASWDPSYSLCIKPSWFYDTVFSRSKLFSLSASPK